MGIFDKAKDALSEHSAQVATGIDKAGDFVDEKTGGKYVEQVEEVATMSDLVAVVRRSKDNIEAIEDYIQREQKGEAADPSAPAIAGG
jgi:hypothetical protein